MSDSTPALTDAERSYGRVDPGLQLRGRWYSEASVARIKADAVAAALAPVEQWAFQIRVNPGRPSERWEFDRDLLVRDSEALARRDQAEAVADGWASEDLRIVAIAPVAAARAALAEGKGGER